MATNRTNEYKAIIQKHISAAIEEIGIDNDLGYFPNNIEVAMTDAAYAVVSAVEGTNIYFKQENMLADN